MRVRCRDIDVDVREWGRGRPLVLVHGIGEDHRSWRRLLPHLALGAHVVAYDVRGHGGTTLGAADGTARQLAGDLIGLLDALDLERADVCGHSLGGTIALAAAIAAPSRFRGLVPAATSSRVGRAVRPWYEERAALADAGPDGLGRALEEDARGMLGGDPGLAAEQARIRREAMGGGAGYANACRAMAALAATPLDPDLGAVTATTRVVAGELDTLCPPRAGELIVAAIPGATLHVVPGAGHHLPLQCPRELAAHVRAAMGLGA